MGELSWLDIFKGAGSILGAGATYFTGKEQNKLAKEKLDYQKSQDSKAEAKLDMAQANLDNAISSVYGTEEDKKKKKTSATDLSMAYGTPSTEI